MAKAEGRAKGGVARAEALSAKARKAIAKKAAQARWGDDIPTATHIGEIEIGDLKLPCAVLPDGTRVISLGGMSTAFGPVTGGWQQRQRAVTEGDLPPFTSRISDHLGVYVMAPHALTSQATDGQRCEFLAGYFTEQFSAGKRPEYGYPKNHLPETTLDRIEVTTGFMVAKSGK